jgi:hypothetical protein
MHAHKRLLAALAGLALSFAAAAPARAIDGGVPDGDRHPNVGALAFDVDAAGPTPPFAICTGSVISDHAFLTARHCIEPPLVALPPNVQWAVTLEPGTPSAPILPGGFVPADYPGCCGFTVDESKIARATGVALHPGYVPGFVPGSGVPTAGAHDVAVVLFPAGTFAGVRPVRLVRPGALEHLGAAGRRHGPQLTLVGYGAEVRDTGFYAPGYRKTARAPVHDVSTDWLLFVNHNDGRPRSGALCSGDSGSPQFLGGSTIQVSLLHDAGASCSGIGYSQRLDTPAEQRFLAPYLPESRHCAHGSSGKLRAPAAPRRSCVNG